MRQFYLVLLVGLLACATTWQAAETSGLQQVQTIPLANVEGRIDHFSVDIQGKRLFVSALGNNTLEVIDLQAGKRATSISGPKEPQGVLYVPGLNKIFVTNAGDGTCRIFDTGSYRPIDTLRFSSDADNVRYDPARKQVYVGYGEGALAIIDAATNKLLGEIPLRGHPESFQLETSGPRIFVNVPTAGHIAVVDREKRAIVATWPIEEARANFSMALDEPDHRLFVVSRRPARLLVLDARSGKVLVRLPSVGDADDVFYDAAHKRIYISGGEGFLEVFKQDDSDHYRRIERIGTAFGARTSLFVPELNRLYLAVPHRGSQGAEVRVYEVQP